jgi:hypothetical protein
MASPMEAVIQTTEGETPYRRAGRGPGLLLLQRAPPARSGDALFDALAETFLVIAPLVPPPGRRGAAERWLQGLIEGLGLDTPDIVADAELAPVLSRFVRRGGELAGRALFLQGGGGDEESRIASFLGAVPREPPTR